MPALDSARASRSAPRLVLTKTRTDPEDLPRNDVSHAVLRAAGMRSTACEMPSAGFPRRPIWT